MSIRAHRVTRLDTADYTSFNVWHDEELVNFLDKECNFSSHIGNDDSGIVEVRITVLRKALDTLKLKGPDLREALEKDIKAAEDAGSEYVMYYVF